MISAALMLLETDEQRNELAKFYKKSRRRLYRIAFSKLHSREAAEDAVMETFLQLSSNPESFFGLSEKEQVRYANVVARNISIKMYKKENRIETVELSENASYSDSENPTEKELLFKFTKSELTEFIAGLPPLQRDILYLKTVCKLSTRQIAEKFEMTENAVGQRLFQARKAIREALKKGEL